MAGAVLTGCGLDGVELGRPPGERFLGRIEIGPTRLVWLVAEVVHLQDVVPLRLDEDPIRAIARAVGIPDPPAGVDRASERLAPPSIHLVENVPHGPKEGHHRRPTAAEGYGVGRELRLLQGSPAVG